jgi:hypothetical protein
MWPCLIKQSQLVPCVMLHTQPALLQHRNPTHIPLLSACRLSVCLLFAGSSQHVVFVWDADDTLVPLHSLVTGQYSVQAGGGLEGSSASALGRKLQGQVLQLADAHMHFKEVRIHAVG